jgi:hypothetical protein
LRDIDMSFRPGPPPGSGREPVIMQGQDRQMYRASKDEASYSPRFDAHAPYTCAYTRTRCTHAHVGEREEHRERKRAREHEPERGHDRFP